jgi:hypothetical protein
MNDQDGDELCPICERAKTTGAPTLRDQFAMAALHDAIGWAGFDDAKHAALCAYEVADAMLAGREKSK